MSRLDEDLVQRVDQLGRSNWAGITYRYTTIRRDPLSGAGARLNGGRWNPPDIFATVYLATPAATCAAELRRLASSQGTTTEILLQASWRFHTISVSSLEVLDLRNEGAMEQVGLGMDDVIDDDWTACQAVGQAAWFLGFQGVLAPSATGEGLVLAAFESRVAHLLQVSESVSFTPELLKRISEPN